jgi:hypothetical protein
MVINRKVIAGAIAVALAVTIYVFLTLNGVAYQQATTRQATAYLTILAPGNIPTADISLLSATATPTVDTSLGDLKGIRPNLYVQITGTSGVGLKIRQDPGLNGTMNFVANETEVFQVVDGPIKKDNLIWWKLVTPYDRGRQGWAAAEYLSLIQNQ